MCKSKGVPVIAVRDVVTAESEESDLRFLLVSLSLEAVENHFQFSLHFALAIESRRENMFRGFLPFCLQVCVSSLLSPRQCPSAAL